MNSRQVDVLDPSELSLEGNFNNQLNNLLKCVRLSRAEVEDISRLIDDLQDALQYQWPGCKVMLFGSIVCGLGIVSSDVDCFVQLPYWCDDPQDSLVITARNTLRAYPMIFKELFAIVSAKVPILKFFHKPTGRYCDVNFKSPGGVQNSNLLAYLVKMDPRVLPLTILIKYWSKVHKLSGTNLLPNYSLTMLTVFYLQVKGVLPPIKLLQIGAQASFIENWNMAFSNVANYNSDCKETIYQLLGGFFKYYSSFNFDKDIVAPYVGHTLDKEIFKRDIPDDFILYKEHIRRKKSLPLKVDTSICVQDAFEHARNCSVAVYPKLASKIFSYIKYAARMFEEQDENTFLSSILLSGPEEFIDKKITKKKSPKKHVQGIHKQNQEIRKFKQNTGKYIHNLYNQIRFQRRRC